MLIFTEKLNFNIALFFLIAVLKPINAQQDSSWQKAAKTTLNGFIDSYYAYDFHKPSGLKRQNFLYNHNRHNQFAINLAYIKYAAYHTKYRAAFALHSGTYVEDNYANEPKLLSHINEATVGISITKLNKVFLDLGVFPSYIGFESAISIDNPTLSRSLLAENSPYFMTGAKVSYTPTKKIDVMIMLNNGWQRIQKIKGNSLLGLGTQLIYRPTEKFSFNWSTFIGTEDPDTIRRMRYFNNLYATLKLKQQLFIVACFDIGSQQQTKKSDHYSFWFSPALIIKKQLSKVLSLSLRGEYYHDPQNTIIITQTNKGFKCASYSFNFDYKPTDFASLRFEARVFSSLKPIFAYQNLYVNSCLLTSLAIKF